MDTISILTHSLWTGLLAAGLGVMLTAPVRYLIACFCCGFIGRGVKDVAIAFDLSVNWATVLAALTVVLIAVAILRRHSVSPVVLICGVLPLGASVAMFNLIFALMEVSSAKGEDITEHSLALASNLGKVFTITLAVAVGLGAGMAIVRLFKPRNEVITA